MFTQDQLKQQVAQAALDYVLPQLQPDSILGVGTGSTVDLFIDLLAAHRAAFHAAVSSSERSTRRLQAAGIAVLDLNDVKSMALYVDGADEIDHQLNMIKGGGGALTREKIVASVADRFVCIVDESKLVEQLGGFDLPIEIIPLAREAVIREIRQLGGGPQLRDGFITDNGNQILDVAGLYYENDPAAFEAMLNNIPGIVCCGLFAISGAHVALVAGQNGVSRLELQDD
ncbi:ribose-5-phosphate isomerase RpiA [Castellaniella sp.]|uniref:ribose-5-phosphate isomerase RpiA n=1 Tax=Castellaniella sp. TaxID=1955812 RepID=UPI002AFFFE4E|nr:ribose-5-phosphate isomerase RpiA [Castellaniella sp.]